MTDPGQRPHSVAIQQQGPPTDDGYNPIPGAWSTIATAWARVRYGTGAERREAAQENATQAATFEFDWSPETAAIRPTDRLVCFDTAWDVASAVTVGANAEVHVTAVANLDAEIDS